jgi:hypothetical protein
VDGAAGVQADEGLVEHLGEVDGTTPGQRMPGRDDEDQPVAPVGLGFQSAQAAFGRHHANFDLPGGDSLNDRRARLLFQTDANARVFAQEIAKVFRQKAVDRVGVGKNVTWLCRPLA